MPSGSRAASWKSGALSMSLGLMLIWSMMSTDRSAGISRACWALVVGALRHNKLVRRGLARAGLKRVGWKCRVPGCTADGRCGGVRLYVDPIGERRGRGAPTRSDQWAGSPSQATIPARRPERGQRGSWPCPPHRQRKLASIPPVTALRRDIMSSILSLPAGGLRLSGSRREDRDLSLRPRASNP